MASVALVCSKCKATLSMPSGANAARVKCPKCQAIVSVPTATNQPTVDQDQSRAEQRTRDLSDPMVESQSSEVQLGGETRNFLRRAEKPDELGRLGHFRVLKELGRGGMGVVYLAEDLRLLRHVAIKVMLPQFAELPHAKGRFLREARTAANIENDHIITIHDVDEDNGVPFLTMPVLKGEPLNVRLKRDGKLPVKDVLRIGIEICDGLQAAHAREMVHRDLKPGNIWLEGARSRVKILDFGLARAVEGQETLTKSGVVLGTPAYMAPEQARDPHVDGRADLFSLGVILYQMTTGKMPFRGHDTMSTLYAVCNDAPQPPSTLVPDLPPELDSLILKLLAKDPDQRFESAEQTGVALEAVAHNYVELHSVTGTEVQSKMNIPAARPVASSPATESANDRDFVFKEAKSVVSISSAEIPTRPRSEGNRPPQRFGRWAVVLGIVAFVAAGGWLVWQQVIRVDTPEGTLVVEVNDPAIEVAVKMDGVQIEHKTKRRTFTLRPGNGQITFHDPDSGVHLETQQFKILSGKKELVRAHVERVAAKDKLPAKVDGSKDKNRPADEDGYEADRRAAELVDGRANIGLRLANGDFITRSADAIGIPLPKEPFRLTDLRSWVERNPKIQKKDVIATFAKLRHLETFGDWSSSFDWTDDDIAQLAKAPFASELITLNLIHTDIHPKMIDAMRGFPKLRAIAFQFRDADDALMSRIVTDLPRLRSLIMFVEVDSLPAKISLKGISSLANLPLTYFRVESNGNHPTSIPIPQEWCQQLAKFPALDNLLLRHVDNAGLAELANCRNLLILDFGGKKVDDAGLDSVQKITSLEHVNIKEGTLVTETGLQNLAQALPWCKIQWNGKTFNRLFEGSEKELMELAMAPDATEIKRIRLTKSRLTSNPVDMFKPYPHLRGLEIHAGGFEDKTLVLIANTCPDLAYLNLHVAQQSRLTETGLRALEKLPLRRFLLEAGDLDSPKMFAALPSFRMMERCKLWIGPNADACMSEIAKCPRLAVLELHSGTVTDAGLRHLANLKTLRRLYLNSDRVTAAGIEALATALPGCQIEWKGSVRLKQP